MNRGVGARLNLIELKKRKKEETKRGGNKRYGCVRDARGKEG